MELREEGLHIQEQSSYERKLDYHLHPLLHLGCCRTEELNSTYRKHYLSVGQAFADALALEERTVEEGFFPLEEG